METFQVISPVAFIAVVFIVAILGTVFRADVTVRAEHALAAAICFCGFGAYSMLGAPPADVGMSRHVAAPKVEPAKTEPPSVNRSVADFIAAHFDSSKAKELANARSE